MAETLVAHASVTIDAPATRFWNALVDSILRFEPERLLEYDHSLPIYRSSGGTHTLDNHLRVTIELRDGNGRTRVSVTEHGNRNQREFEHSEGSWRMLLHGMKALLEGTSAQEGRP